MPEANGLQRISAALWIWQAYDPASKSELFSTAAASNGTVIVIDPIPLAQSALAELLANGPVSGIVVTNTNHIRAAESFATTFNASACSSAAVVSQLGVISRCCADGEKIAAGLTTVEIEGAAPGEIALHFDLDGGTIIIGDALINFDPLGFALLPRKYCADQKIMRSSLRRLLDFSFERLLFAHGNPIVSGARGRLEALVADD